MLLTKESVLLFTEWNFYTVKFSDAMNWQSRKFKKTNSSSLANLPCVTVTIFSCYCYQPLDLRSSNCIVGIIRNKYNCNCLSHSIMVFVLASHMYALRTYFYFVTCCFNIFTCIKTCVLSPTPTLIPDEGLCSKHQICFY